MGKYEIRWSLSFSMKSDTESNIKNEKSLANFKMFKKISPLEIAAILPLANDVCL